MTGKTSRKKSKRVLIDRPTIFRSTSRNPVLNLDWIVSAIKTQRQFLRVYFNKKLTQRILPADGDVTFRGYSARIASLCEEERVGYLVKEGHAAMPEWWDSLQTFISLYVPEATATPTELASETFVGNMDYHPLGKERCVKKYYVFSLYEHQRVWIWEKASVGSKDCSHILGANRFHCEQCLSEVKKYGESFILNHGDFACLPATHDILVGRTKNSLWASFALGVLTYRKKNPEPVAHKLKRISGYGSRMPLLIDFPSLLRRNDLIETCVNRRIVLERDDDGDLLCGATGHVFQAPARIALEQVLDGLGKGNPTRVENILKTKTKSRDELLDFFKDLHRCRAIKRKGLAFFFGRKNNNREGRSLIHCIGDSDIRIFKTLEENQIFSDVTFIPLPILAGELLPSASAATDGIAETKRILEQLPNIEHLVIGFGAVDCTVTSLFYAAWRKGKPKKILDEGIERYKDFLVKIKGCFRSFTVIGPIPMFIDGRNEKTIIYERAKMVWRIVKPTMREVVDLIIHFDSRMESHCTDRGIRYVKVTEAMLDHRTGLPDQKFFNPDIRDCHAHPVHHANLLAKLLIKGTLERI